MNKHDNKLDSNFGVPGDCDSFELLISASIDDDLSDSEQDILNEHLDSCSNCQQLALEFASVNTAVELLGCERQDVETAKNNLAETSKPLLVAAEDTKTNWFSVWRLIPIGVAATLAVCLAITAWPNPKPVNANQISPEQITKPILELETLNQRKQKDQDLMLRTLGMDLRAMKLEINQLDPESDERKRLEAQIDSMITKVRSFESSTN